MFTYYSFYVLLLDQIIFLLMTGLALIGLALLGLAPMGNNFREMGQMIYKPVLFPSYKEGDSHSSGTPVATRL